MRLIDAQSLGQQLLRAHELEGWTLVFDNAKARAGACRFNRREVSLSRPSTRLRSEPDVRDTILHEIAHALAGHAAGHGPDWRRTALRIGASPTRCVVQDTPMPPAPWTGICPAGHESFRHKRPERVQSCSRCSKTFSGDNLISWQLHGRPAQMHPNYVAEFARIAGGRKAGLKTGEAMLASTFNARLRVGTQVRFVGGGAFGGLEGRIEKRGRTRYHVRTARGLVAAPFALVTPA